MNDAKKVVDAVGSLTIPNWHPADTIPLNPKMNDCYFNSKRETINVYDGEKWDEIYLIGYPIARIESQYLRLSIKLPKFIMKIIYYIKGI